MPARTPEAVRRRAIADSRPPAQNAQAILPGLDPVFAAPTEVRSRPGRGPKRSCSRGCGVMRSKPGWAPTWWLSCTARAVLASAPPGVGDHPPGRPRPPAGKLGRTARNSSISTPLGYESFEPYSAGVLTLTQSAHLLGAWLGTPREAVPSCSLRCQLSRWPDVLSVTGVRGRRRDLTFETAARPPHHGHSDRWRQPAGRPAPARG
jgi:hypothetical protein